MDDWMLISLGLGLVFGLLPAGRGSRAWLIERAGDGPRALRLARQYCERRYLPFGLVVGAGTVVDEARRKDWQDSLLAKIGQ